MVFSPAIGPASAEETLNMLITSSITYIWFIARSSYVKKNSTTNVQLPNAHCFLKTEGRPEPAYVGLLACKMIPMGGRR